MSEKEVITITDKTPRCPYRKQTITVEFRARDETTTDTEEFWAKCLLMLCPMRSLGFADTTYCKRVQREKYS